MADLAEEISAAVGDDRLGKRLLARTRQVADRCALDPKLDLGVGSVHFPELSFASNGSAIDVTVPGAAARVLYDRCISGFHRRGMPMTGKSLMRLDSELSMIGTLGYPSYFLTVADVVDLIKSHGVRCAARGSGAGSFVNYLLGISDVDPHLHFLADTFRHRHGGDTTGLRASNDPIRTEAVLVQELGELRSLSGSSLANHDDDYSKLLAQLRTHRFRQN